MAGRENLFSLCRRAFRSTVMVALVAVCLVGAGLIAKQVAAKRAVNAGAPVTSPAVGTASLISLDGRVFEQSDGQEGAVVGEFDGYFDAKTRSLSLQSKALRSIGGKDNRLYARSNPGTEVTSGFIRQVLRSQFVNTSATSSTVTGEVELTNGT